MKRTGKRIRSGDIDVRVAVSPFSYPRVGIVVPRYRHSIVERNRLRRRLRELVRLELFPVLGPADVVLFATPASYERTFAALRADIRGLASRLTLEAATIPGKS